MKKLLNTVFAVLFAVSVVGVVGCGDDDNDTPTDVVETGDVAETPEDVAETPEEVVAEVVEATGACTNEADDALLATEELRDGVTAAATDCGVGCLGEDPDNIGACSVACLVAGTGLSAECSTCYAGMVGCTKDFCLDVCLLEPGSDECAACQTEEGCFEAFYACSGLPEPTE